MERHRLEHLDNDPHVTRLQLGRIYFISHSNIMRNWQNYFISSCVSKVFGTLLPTEGLADIPGTMRQLWPNRLLDRRRTVMGIIMWLVVGGVIGWLASIVMRTDGQQGIILNIVVGIIGSFIGGLIFSQGDINNAPLTVMTFLVSLVGAIILLAIVNLVRRSSIR